MKRPTFQNIALGAISLGKTNPRKSFDQGKVKELTESILEKGVLQPIIVRCKEGDSGYELVCGERRYRASMQVYELNKERLTIPAVIYANLSDADALEMQITENLQRVDVHPLEEAVAFKSILELNKYTVDELAKRLGKSHYYVGQRLKLNSLIEDLQKLLFEDRMSLATALKLCQFSTEVQQKLWDKELKKQSGRIEISAWVMREYLGDLKAASFDLADHTLNPKMGACHSCIHNTAHEGNLFPEEAKAARCLLVSCYQEKAKKHFDIALEEARNDGTVIFLNRSYGKTERVARLEKAGVKVYDRYDVDQQSQPEPPDLEEYQEALGEGEYKNQEEMTAAFDKAMANFEKKVKSLENKLKSGEYTKAFIVDGEGVGSYTPVKITKKDVAKSKGSDKGTLLPARVEIERLKERQKRNKELDEIKVLPAVHSIFEDQIWIKREDDEDALTKKVKAPLHTPGVHALILFLCEKAGWMAQEELYKAIGIKEPESNDEEDEDDVLYKAISKMSEAKLQEVVNIFARVCLVKFLTPTKFSTFKNPKMATLREIALVYDNKKFEQVTSAQNEIAAKREARVAARIKQLETVKAQEKTDQPAKSKKKKPGKGDAAATSVKPKKKAKTAAS